MRPSIDSLPALDDAWDSVCWIAANGDEVDADSSRLAVGGDSAGGTLAATVCRRARDEGGPAICFQVLVYPVTDMTLSHPSHDGAWRGIQHDPGNNGVV